MASKDVGHALRDYILSETDCRRAINLPTQSHISWPVIAHRVFHPFHVEPGLRQQALPGGRWGTGR